MAEPPKNWDSGLFDCFEDASTSLGLRIGIRNRYGIKGSICKDILASCFCGWCSWCQMHRELKARKAKTTIIVNMQPGPLNAPVPGVVIQQGIMMAPH
ncbi:cornifelin homolog A-like [Pempheris klunzingeri]|uniref:cornifelin homolog A-like n=1 Tax=Pempheris klunzingeri TaxID=3127111 RepID=UPI00397E95EA